MLQSSGCIFFNLWPSSTPFTLSLHDALPISIRPDRFDRPLNSPSNCSPRLSARKESHSDPEKCLLPHPPRRSPNRSEEHTSELQSHSDLVCRLLLEKKKSRVWPSHSLFIAYA